MVALLVNTLTHAHNRKYHDFMMGRIRSKFKERGLSVVPMKEIPTRKGRRIKASCFAFNGIDIIVKGSFLKIASLWEEDYDDLTDPAAVINDLKAMRNRPDLFTFKQRYPYLTPKHQFHLEYDSIAVLPITTYDNWINGQLSTNSRRLIAKAIKCGVQVKIVEFDSIFIEGMRRIFSEAPFRQGKRFWHYRKDNETIKSEFSKYLFREDIIGAYLDNILIGFLFLARAGRYAMPSQILSSLAHRDKGVTNVLLAQAVSICAREGLTHIVYGDWQESGLTEFKRRNGFVRIDIPRYYVPLSKKGILAIHLRAHRGLSRSLPTRLRWHLKRIRSSWSTFGPRGSR